MDRHEERVPAESLPITVVKTSGPRVHGDRTYFLYPKPVDCCVFVVKAATPSDLTTPTRVHGDRTYLLPKNWLIVVCLL